MKNKKLLKAKLFQTETARDDVGTAITAASCRVKLWLGAVRAQLVPPPGEL